MIWQDIKCFLFSNKIEKENKTKKTSATLIFIEACAVIFVWKTVVESWPFKKISFHYCDLTRNQVFSVFQQDRRKKTRPKYLDFHWSLCCHFCLKNWQLDLFYLNFDFPALLCREKSKFSDWQPEETRTKQVCAVIWVWKLSLNLDPFLKT